VIFENSDGKCIIIIKDRKIYLLKIMNAVHKRIFIFGIENINVSDDCTLLDLGFGGVPERR